MQSVTVTSSRASAFAAAVNIIADRLRVPLPVPSDWQVAVDDSVGVAVDLHTILDPSLGRLDMLVANRRTNEVLRLVGVGAGVGAGVGFSPVDITFNGDGEPVTSSDLRRIGTDMVAISAGQAMVVPSPLSVQAQVDLFTELKAHLPELPGNSAIFLGPAGGGLSGTNLFGGLAVAASASISTGISPVAAVTLFCRPAWALETAFLPAPLGELVAYLDVKAILLQLGDQWSTDISAGVDATAFLVTASAEACQINTK